MSDGYMIDDNDGGQSLKKNDELVPLEGLELGKKRSEGTESIVSSDGLSMNVKDNGDLVPLYGLGAEENSSSGSSSTNTSGNKLARPAGGIRIPRKPAKNKSRSEYETMLVNAIDEGSLEDTYIAEMHRLHSQKNIASLPRLKEILEGNIQDLRQAFVCVHNGAVYQIELQKKYEKMLSEAASRGNLPYSYAAELNHINDSLKMYEKEVISKRKSALDKAYKKVKGKRGTIAAVLMLLIAVVAFSTFIFVKMNVATLNNNDNEKNLLAENLKIKEELQNTKKLLEEQQKINQDTSNILDDLKNKGKITQEEYEAKVRELQNQNETLANRNKLLADEIEKNNQAIVAATVAEEEKVNKKNRAEIKRISRERKLASERFKPGNHVILGSYPYDERGNKKAIEWIVLDNSSDGYALLASRYALDAQKYEAAGGNALYAVSSIRRWLNGTFMSSAFSSEEQSRIRQTLIKTQNSDNTQDYVFLLSHDEAKRYFASDSQRSLMPTGWAKKQGAVSMVKDRGACWWWLRSPGRESDNAFGVASDGLIDEDFTDSVAAVRPALWYKIYD